MKRVLLRPAARADLTEIWRYTVQRWGVEQADHYVAEIERAGHALADGSRQGRSIADIREGYFKLPTGRHLLIYRFGEDAIDIVRILHQRMDLPAHLQ